MKVPFFIQLAKVVCLWLISALAAAEENPGGSFRDVLELAGVGPKELAKFSDEPEYQEDWQLLIQLLHRLDQFSQAEQDKWVRSWGEATEENAGGLFDVAGSLEEVESIALPTELADRYELPSLYRCRYRFANVDSEAVGHTGIVISSQVPKRCQTNVAMEEPIKFRGILLKVDGELEKSTVFVTNHLVWYPEHGVPTGQLLLARNGMDVALLDEIVQRQPFVKPEVSREGEAFYACLATLARIDGRKIDELAQQNVADNAKKWQESFESSSGTGNNSERQEKIESKRRQEAMAFAVRERSELGLSSVAPLFIQPEQEVGELVRIEGIARRAIRIAATDQPEVESYYELEMFPPDSQNLPVVCCVSRLPAGFPTGDEIREPVRVAGVFFKSWRYRTRQNAQGPGQTGRQQALYTPLIVGKAPTWLEYSASGEGRWALWGGIGFFASLAIVWIWLALLARRDRRIRSVNRPAKIDIRLNDTRVEPTE